MSSSTITLLLSSIFFKTVFVLHFDRNSGRLSPKVDVSFQFGSYGTQVGGNENKANSLSAFKQ